MKDKSIVGFATYDVMVLTGSFGPTGVPESARGLGLGDMKNRGDRRCEIIWVGPIAYYAHTVDARISATFTHSTKVL